MNALAREEVGTYLNLHCVSAFQKVGTFRINGSNKQGGNVASYFCTPEGQVIHAVAGPANAAQLIREAQWAVEIWKLAQLTGQNMSEWRKFVRDAHLERLRRDHRVHLQEAFLPSLTDASWQQIDPWALKLSGSRLPNSNKSGKVHHLLASYPCAHISRIYSYVFEDILNEKISTAPVVSRN